MIDLSNAASKLIAAQPGEGSSSKEVADRIARALERLTSHLSRLIGAQGVATLLNRSIALASATSPWLAAAVSPTGDAASALRDVMAQQEHRVAAEAFAAVLSTFVGLLKRLIGDGLVDRLLNEVWPAVFPHAVKETP